MNDALCRVFVAVVSGRAHASRRAAIRATWGGAVPVAGVTWQFFVGDPAAGAAEADDVCVLDCPDRYEDLPKKTFALLAHLAESRSFSHVLKCDDDTYVDLARVARLRVDGIDYGGERHGRKGVDRWWHALRTDGLASRRPYDGPWLGPWAGGGAYLLSRQAVDVVLATGKEYFDGEFYEDKAVGDALRRRGVPLRDMGAHFRTILGLDDAARAVLGDPGVTALHPIAPELMPTIQALSRIAGTRAGRRRNG